VLETLGFHKIRSERGVVELARGGDVIVLPETGAVSRPIVDRLADAAGIDSDVFVRLLLTSSSS